MLEIRTLSIEGYEKVIEGVDHATGLHCFIAIHDTSLGPALGGVRFWPYASREEALSDVLRLAQAMTYKSAMSEVGLGGGKAVILAKEAKHKTEEMLFSFAQVINYLQGQYISAEDVGTDTKDIDCISKASPYVAATSAETSSGDPSRFTAWGIFCGMKAIASKLWGSPSLRGKVVAIQGLGHVGSKLARLLFWHGAEIILCDMSEAKAHEFALRYGAKIVPPNMYLSTPCDILSPCALGGILNDATIPTLQCQAIAGSANNQLWEPKHGDMLQKVNILYAPDYVINAGGVINAATEFDEGGYDPKKSRDKAERIYDILTMIFEKSEKEGKPTHRVADELAEYKLTHQIGKRTHSISFDHPM